MISKQNLKQKLLDLDIVNDNEYLDKYVDVIFRNISSLNIKYETQKHHFIPKSYFIHRNIPIDDSKDNLINLSIADHIRVHYYLFKCMKNNDDKYSNIYALRRMLGGKFTDFNRIETLDDEECAQLYRDYCEQNRLAHIGKTHITSDETKQKIGLANKDKYQNYKTIHNEEGVEKRVSQEELPFYLDGGWILGRSEKSIQGLKQGYNYNSKGMLGKTQSDFQKEQARKAQLGKEKSSETKQKISLAHAGKKLYTNPATGKSIYIYPDEIDVYEKQGYVKYHKNK